jgi:hypothetical protein
MVLKVMQQFRSILYLGIMVFGFASCTPSLKNYSPNKKFAVSDLQSDYSLMRNILEKKHPSLYWYTPKDSMDYFFDFYYNKIKDSMTENQFGWQVIAPLLNKIKCGHTSFLLSKKDQLYNSRNFKGFPLGLKFYKDSMIVWGSLIPKDSIFSKGTIIQSIDGLSANHLKEMLFDCISKDGEESNLGYTLLSNNFGYFYKSVTGSRDSFTVAYIDSVGRTLNTSIHTIDYYGADEKKSKNNKNKRQRKIEKLDAYRSLSIDSTNTYAVMTLNTFLEGQLTRFFKNTFSELRHKKINNLIIDIRNNGGGSVNKYILLSRYISKSPFKICDTLFSKVKSLKPYTSYFKSGILINMQLFVTGKLKSDGRFHEVSSERMRYYPKKKNHFNGNVYVLINGGTFSASSMFVNCIKGQKNIHIVGENSGGGWYGNNGMVIPNITLPNTKVRIRVPLYRLVQYNHNDEHKGTGIVPDIIIPTDHQFIKEGRDKKMEVVIKMISEEVNSN